MDPIADPDPMDVDPVVSPSSSSASAAATASGAAHNPGASDTSACAGNEDVNDSRAAAATAIPSRPPRRSAALAAKAALAASADSDSPTTPGSASGPRPSASDHTASGPTADKWVTYLADCRAQSLFTSRPLRHVRPHNLTTDLLAYDFTEPFYMTDPPSEIGMFIPDNFSPDLIAEQAGGPDRILEIVNVADQSEVKMPLAEWVEYFKTPKDQRHEVLNLLSLEISQQPSGRMIQRPWIVRQMDLVSRFWPSKRQHAGDMPNFQLYCLMGTEGSFTDFHIDFGGTSVFYHIIQGQKTFLFIQPTPANLRLYDAWVKADTRTRGNLADQVSEVLEVHATAGQTLWIPSGWIHAVHTPVDTLVVGGNFLTSRYLASQISIHLMESAQSIDAKFLLPNFSDILWYTLDDFAHLPADRIDAQQAVELIHLCAFLAQHPLLDEHAAAEADTDPDAGSATPGTKHQQHQSRLYPLPPGDLTWDKPAFKILRTCVQRAHQVLRVWNPAMADKVSKVVDGVVFVSMCAEQGLPEGAVVGARKELDRFVRVAGTGGGPSAAHAGAGAGALGGAGAAAAGGKKKGAGKAKKAEQHEAPREVEGKGKSKAGKPKPGSADAALHNPRASEPSSSSRAKPQPRKPAAASKHMQPLESSATASLRRASAAASSSSSPLSSVPSTAHFSSSSPPPKVPGTRRTRSRSTQPPPPLHATPAGAELVHDTTSDLSSEEEMPRVEPTRARVPVVDVDAQVDHMDVDGLEPAPVAAAAVRKRERPKAADTSAADEGHQQGLADSGRRVLAQFELRGPGVAGAERHGADGSAGAAKTSVVEMHPSGGSGQGGGRRRSKRSAPSLTADGDADDSDTAVVLQIINRKSKPASTTRARKKPASADTQPLSGDIDPALIAAVSQVLPSSSPSSSATAGGAEPDSDTSPAIPLRASARLRVSSASSIFSVPTSKQPAADDSPPAKKRRTATSSADARSIAHSPPPAPRLRRDSASSNSSAASSSSGSASARRRSLTSAHLGLSQVLGGWSAGFPAILSRRRIVEIEAEAQAMLVAHVADEVEMGVDVDWAGGLGKNMEKVGEGDVTEDEDAEQEARAEDPSTKQGNDAGGEQEDREVTELADAGARACASPPLQPRSRSSPTLQVVVEVPLPKFADEARMRMLAEEAHKAAAVAAATAAAASGDGRVEETEKGGGDPLVQCASVHPTRASAASAGMPLVPYLNDNE